MADGFFLNEEEARDFQQMRRWFRDVGLSGDLISRQFTGQHFSENEDHQAPEVYVASVPGTIPPLQFVVGGADRPGSATCQIYKLNPSGELIRVPGLTKVVYNLSLVAVDSPWIVISRSKYGYWYVDCPCTLGPPTGTGTGTTGTGTTGTGTGTDTGTGTGDGNTGTAGDCCDDIPTTLRALVWFEEISDGSICAQREITLTKAGNVWSGVVTNWCSDPATFDIEVTCVNGVPSISIHDDSGGVTYTTRECSPLELIGTSTDVNDSSCCSGTPGPMHFLVDEN